MSDIDYAALCEAVASDWEIGGMDGIYSDFATEVAKRAVAKSVPGRLAEALEKLITAVEESCRTVDRQFIQLEIDTARAALSRAKGETQ